MDIPEIKKETGVEQVVKVEASTDQEGAATMVLQDISEFGEVQEQIISAANLPYIYNSDGSLQIAAVDDGQYTYIIEQPDGYEEGAEFELADGEHYIIEEYEEQYGEEESQDSQSQYETMYIQHIESSQQETEVETAEIYTISEELDAQYSEEDNQQEDDDQQMEIVEETEVISKPHILEEKPLPTASEQKKLQVKIKEILKSHKEKQQKVPHTTKVKSASAATKQQIKQEKQHIKQEIELEIVDLPENAEGQDEDSEISHAEAHQDTAMLTTQVQKNDVDEDFVYEEKKPSKNDLEFIFECSICGKGFKTPTSVKRHINMSHWKSDGDKKDNNDFSFSLCPCCGEPSDSAHTTGDFECKICDKLFIQQNSLDRHMSIDHPDGDKYECYDCKKIFKVKDQLIEHTRVHSLKSVKCDDCGREFTRKYHLDRHIGQTGCMGVAKQVYECRVCGKSFTRKDNLADHLKAHAGLLFRKQKKFTCEFCMKEFNGVALLNIHIRTHTGERPYGCDICEKKFPSSGAMKKHRRMHTGEKPYTCPQCGNKFAAKETLNRHWRTHTGEKPHQCKFCGKSFIQAAQLRAHIFHHTGENAYTCPHCNRAFNRKLRLTTHIKFMHEGAEPLNCPQDGCNKTFFRKEDIHRHLMTHSGEKPYECEVCKKAFVVKSSLKIHQLTHRKEQAVSCEVCSRAFIRQDCLMRHMRARHRDVLEDIVANAEKKRLQEQLLQAVTSAANKDTLKDTIVWNELTLTESIKELLSLLVDEECLSEFGHPEAPVDKVLESVIKRCGHCPAAESDFDYIGKMRENAKLLFTVVIDDRAVKELLNNQTVDEVIRHVLKLAKNQVKGSSFASRALAAKEDEEEEEVDSIEEKPNVERITIQMNDDDENITTETSNDTLQIIKKKYKDVNPYIKKMNDRIEYVVQNSDSAEGSIAETDEAQVDHHDYETDEVDHPDFVDANESMGNIEDEENDTNPVESLEEIMETENADSNTERMEFDGEQLEIDLVHA